MIGFSHYAKVSGLVGSGKSITLCPLFEGLYVKVLRAKVLSCCMPTIEQLVRKGPDCDRAYKQSVALDACPRSARR